MIGIVDDYTIDYGAKKFVVDLGLYSRDNIDQHMREFVDRVEPGVVPRQRRRQIEASPADLRDRIEHHLRLLLTILYDVIEPAASVP